MKKDTFKTDVIFRKFKDGEIIALFPYEIENYDGSVLSYIHIGQHGGARLDIISKTKLAIETEYKDLFIELSAMGYDLNICKKVNRNKYINLLKEFRNKYNK